MCGMNKNLKEHSFREEQIRIIHREFRYISVRDIVFVLPSSERSIMGNRENVRQCFQRNPKTKSIIKEDLL